MDFASETSSFDHYPSEQKEEPIPEMKAERVSSLKLRFTLGDKPLAETCVPTVKVKEPRDPYAFDASDEDQLKIDERPKKIRKSDKKTPMEEELEHPVFLQDAVLAPVETVGTLELGGEVDVVAYVDPSKSRSSKESKGSKKRKKEKSEKLFIKPETPKILLKPPPKPQETISLGTVLPTIGRMQLLVNERPSKPQQPILHHQPAAVIATAQKPSAAAIAPVHGPLLKFNLRLLEKRSRAPVAEEPAEEPTTNVHQDDDYVYPPLDGSDDEDFVFKPRGRRKMDEAWNPKARVGPVVPKKDRPIREGTKKQAVEKGLEAAAAKRAGQPAAKRAYIRKKPRQVPKSSSPEVNTTTVHGPGNLVIAPIVSAVKKQDKAKKPKKGMKTPKQRLGKILKIHRMNLN